MKLERSNLYGVVVLRVVGEIDFSDTHELLAQLRALDAEGCKRVLINLSACSGMASTAVGILVGWRCESALHGREFWVLCPSVEVREILDMVGITDQLVRPEQSEEAAAKALCKVESKAPG